MCSSQSAKSLTVAAQLSLFYDSPFLSASNYSISMFVHFQDYNTAVPPREDRLSCIFLLKDKLCLGNC